MTWRWEYVPDEETVAAGAPPGFVYMVTPRSEFVGIWQVTPDPLS